MMRTITKVLWGSAIAAATLAATAPLASAHPLGNLTQNTYAGIVVGTTGVEVDYVLDLAELPTVQAKQHIGDVGEGAYRDRECASLRDGFSITAGGRALAFDVQRPQLALLPGQGGLQTLRLTCHFVAAATISRTAALAVTDRNLTDRLGWREMTLVGDGTTVTGSSLPTTSLSDRLLHYPSGRAPLHVVTASATVRPGGPRLAGGGTPAERLPSQPQARGADGLTEHLNRLVSDHRFGWSFAMLAVAIAFVLGALHSLAPGHGKSIMAATVVTRRGGGLRDVGTIGLTVAATHTAGVLVLGTAIWLSEAVAPDRLLPWLTIASGAMVVATGMVLLVRRAVLGKQGHGHVHLFGGHHHHEPHLAAPVRRAAMAPATALAPALAFAGAAGPSATALLERPAPDAGHGHHGHGHHDHHGHDDHDDHGHHDHDDHDDHDHHDHHDHDDHHDHGHHDHAHDDRAAVPSRRWLVAMGIAGGLVPTPSALVVLLGAAALGRAWFGVVLVAIYGIGMASTLMAAGVAMVRLQHWMQRRFDDRAWLRTTLRWAPAVTATLLVGGGLLIAARGAAQL